MDLEDRLRRKIKEAKEENDAEYEKECELRLKLVKESISRKLQSSLGENSP